MFDEFVRILAWTKLSSHASHVNIHKIEKLQSRLRSLQSEALQDFSNLMHKCGLKLNDRERDILYECFDLEDQRCLQYAQFSQEVDCILSPRKRAIVRTLKSFPNSILGSVSVADLVRRAEVVAPARPGHPGNKIEETLNLIGEVRKRLQESLKGTEQRVQVGRESNPSVSHIRSGSQEISSPESLSASDTYQGNQQDASGVGTRPANRRLVEILQFRRTQLWRRQ